jgi:phage baseplate assembly protein W|tara:strand:- start:1134 stop:1535 length:402 start_codon:yes stop_codon:yes gene_type:complete
MASKQGISVKLPLSYDSEDGPYRLTKNLKENVQQNFKNLMLTNPGERVMLPNFGAGIRQLLFEPISEDLFSKVRSRIFNQVRTYMPFVNIEDVFINTMSERQDFGPNEVQISIVYNILPLDAKDTLTISNSTS